MKLMHLILLEVNTVYSLDLLFICFIVISSVVIVWLIIKNNLALDIHVKPIEPKDDRNNIVNTLSSELEDSVSENYEHLNSRPYILMYTDNSIYDLLGLYGKKMDVFLYCLKECDYGNRIILNKRRRDEVRELIGFKTDGAIRNLISRVVKSGLLIKTEYRGEYRVNSDYFYKGKETQSPSLIRN